MDKRLKQTFDRIVDLLDEVEETKDPKEKRKVLEKYAKEFSKREE